jgi:hypothetical protein
MADATRRVLRAADHRRNSSGTFPSASSPFCDGNALAPSASITSEPFSLSSGSARVRSGRRSLLGVNAARPRNSTGCFHFCFQSRITQHHPPAPIVRSELPKCLYWMILGDAGCRIQRIENPRVGGSIPPVATIHYACGNLNVSALIRFPFRAAFRAVIRWRFPVPIRRPSPAAGGSSRSRAWNCAAGKRTRFRRNAAGPCRRRGESRSHGRRSR